MNTNELNRVLSDEIYKLRAGKVKTDRVNAITRAASAIIGAARLQLMHLKIVGDPNQTLPFFGANGKRQIEGTKPKKLKNGKQ